MYTPRKIKVLSNVNESINLDKHWELVNFCEFDKYATKSYCAIHNVDESLNLGDITKVDETKLKPFNMICGGSPCQDFSVAGKQKGSVWTCKDCGHEYNPLTVHWSKRDKCPQCNSSNIEKTRSSLLVEYLRVIRANKPNFGIYENVKNIVGKQFRDTTFKLFEDELHEYGYNTYWKVLNAKNYGIPQNRERVYLIFIRKDLDNGQFKFPEPFDNGIRLKDILEDEVDEKFYLSEEKVQKFLSNFNQLDLLVTTGNSDIYEGVDESNNVKQIGNIVNAGNWSNPQRGRIYSVEGCSPALNTCSGGLEPKIVTGLVSNKGESFEKETAIANTLLARDYKGFGNQPMNAVLNIQNAVIRIRKLTPRECFRLMGFSDQDFDAAKNAGISNSQLYKQAGNSIVVDVLYYIYVELYKAMPYLFDDLKLSSFFSGIGAFETALDRLYEGINSGNFTKVNRGNFMKPPMN